MDDDDVGEQKDFDTNDTIVCLWEKVGASPCSRLFLHLLYVHTYTRIIMYRCIECELNGNSSSKMVSCIWVATTMSFKKELEKRTGRYADRQTVLFSDCIQLL